jgi:hypothetical protein
MTESKTYTQPPKVSVIVPCYNAHAFLGRALESVRAQTFREFEIIVVNDGSTNPETLEYLQTLGDDVRLVHQANLGLPGARNTGFREARGDFVLPLDCDDWLDPTFLAKATILLDTNPDLPYAFAQIALEGNEAGVLKKTYNFFEQLFLNHVPYCIFIRKKIWQQMGGYDEFMRRGCEDWEFNLRLGISGFHGLAIPEPLFHYQVSAKGMLQSMTSDLYAELWSGIQEKHKDAYSLGAIIRVWTEWRQVPANRFLPLYFIYYLAYAALPRPIFMAFYRWLLSISRAARIRAAAYLNS